MFRKRKANGRTVTRKKDDGSSSEEEGPNVIKTMKKSEDARPCKGEVLSSAYSSTREASAVEYGGGATASLEINTDHANDARALLEKSIKLGNEKGEEAHEGVYRGEAARKSYVHRDIAQAGGNKVTGTQGPLRAPTFLRASSRFDYQPDVCKDYKQTGFCGFGDSCKFLHAREDYKAGYQLEKEWEETQRKKRKEMDDQLKGFAKGGGSVESEAEHDDDKKSSSNGLPFACHICRKPFVDPVETVCGHFFCGRCVLNDRQSQKCAVCKADTFGIFNKTDKVGGEKKTEIKTHGLVEAVTEGN